MVAKKWCVQALVLLTAGALLGCGGGTTNTSAPLANFQPEIINTQDNFQFQATSLNQVVGTVQYTWSNTGTRATVNHSSAITSGATMLEVFDADNVRVYADSLKASASDQTATGATGTWRVRVALTQVDGTLNFRLQKL